ncbi:Cupin domain-containing protein [Cladophialophora immunda]|nr:Cupin domain-containing protein [Cladophialophora immunda]
MPELLQASRVPPGKPGQAYTLEYLCGEVIYLPSTKSCFRLLITGRETNNAFAVLGQGGIGSDPIGFHYHRDAHDIFLVVKGFINVWADDQCRTLGPGDYASVPPNIVHQYQVLGDYTEYLSLIVPGGWEDFFRVIGEAYSGPLFRVEDDRKVSEVLFPKVLEAAKTFDVIRVPDHPYVAPQPWDDEKDVLPGDVKPYFLRAGTGPRYLIGGLVCSPLSGIAEAAGRFELGCLEGSSWHGSSILSNQMSFESVHHAFSVVEGAVEILLERATLARVNTGETAYVPPGTFFSFNIVSRYAKVYIWTSGAGLVGVLCKIGSLYKHTVPPEQAGPWDKADLMTVAKEMAMEVMD